MLNSENAGLLTYPQKVNIYIYTHVSAKAISLFQDVKSGPEIISDCGH